MLRDQIDAMTGRAMGDRGNAADQNLPSTPSEHQAFVIGRAESQIGYFHRKRAGSAPSTTGSRLRRSCWRQPCRWRLLSMHRCP